MKFFKCNFLLFTLISFIIVSCDKEESGLENDKINQKEIDDSIITNYLAEHNILATKNSSGLYYVITKEGDGVNPTQNSIVEVMYKGYLTNGTIFDQTGSSSVEFRLTQLIKGWQIGIPLLKAGGAGTFYIPSELGYGDRALSSIPANSVLIFEINLISVK